MALDELLGRIAQLTMCRLGPPGAYLAAPDGDRGPGAEAVLLPRAEVPEGAKIGDAFDVFVYLDSDDRPIATRRPPRLELGEVAFLAVTDAARVGAFVDWGLPKELLVPFAEQTPGREAWASATPSASTSIDTGRLAGTMRISEMLGTGREGVRSTSGSRARRGATSRTSGSSSSSSAGASGWCPRANRTR